jgi:hypothetical protein
MGNQTTTKLRMYYTNYHHTNHNMETCKKGAGGGVGAYSQSRYPKGWSNGKRIVKDKSNYV